MLAPGVPVDGWGLAVLSETPNDAWSVPLSEHRSPEPVVCRSTPPAETRSGRSSAPATTATRTTARVTAPTASSEATRGRIPNRAVGKMTKAMDRTARAGRGMGWRLRSRLRLSRTWCAWCFGAFSHTHIASPSHPLRDMRQAACADRLGACACPGCNASLARSLCRIDISDLTWVAFPGRWCTWRSSLLSLPAWWEWQSTSAPSAKPFTTSAKPRWLRLFLRLETKD